MKSENKEMERTGNLPNFLVIGAQKAGSTWLYNNLKCHTDIFMPKSVELLHFNRPDCLSDVRMREYSRHFDKSEGYKRVGEKTPGYFWSARSNKVIDQPPAGHNSNIPGSVVAALGVDTDIIVSLRHPVQRAISAYAHHAQRNRIDAGIGFEENSKTMGILDIGFYAAHMRAWLEYFPKRQIKTIIFERDIIARPENGFFSCCEFLGVDTSEIPESLKAKVNSGKPRRILEREIHVNNAPSVRPRDVAYLLEAYADDIKELSAILDDPLDDWNQETEVLEEFAKS